MKKVIFQINGGIGKVVMATAVCKAIKKKYPDHKLIVVSGYPEVFLGNPNVYRSYGFGQSAYFYQEHIENNDAIVLAHDPYLSTSYIKQEKHLIHTWCELFDLPLVAPTPELFITEREKNFAKNKYVSDKPILLMQTNGGAEQQVLKYSWARDIPSKIVIDVIDAFKEQYNIVHIKRQDQPQFNFTNPVSDDFRSLVTLISISEKRLFMDSFAQHTASALNLKSTVLWIANKPEVFGYDVHDNIIANPFTKEPELKNSYLNKFDISGDPTQFPYNSEEEIFDAQKVIESLNKEATA